MSGFYLQSLNSKEVHSLILTEVEALALAFQKTLKDSDLTLCVFETGDSMPVYLVKDCRAHQVTLMGRPTRYSKSGDIFGDIACTKDAESEGGLPASDPRPSLANVS